MGKLLELIEKTQKEETPVAELDLGELPQRIRDLCDAILAMINAVSESEDKIVLTVNTLAGNLSKRPNWYKDPIPPVELPKIDFNPIELAVSTISVKLEEAITKIEDMMWQMGEKHEDMMNAISEMKNLSPNSRTSDELARGGVGGIRNRKSSWKVASTIRGNITGAMDGINKEFRIPWNFITDSESVRLNQAAPLSHGEDYTRSANTYTFVIAPGPSDKLEIKGQLS